MIDLRAIAAALPDDPEAYVRLLGLQPHRGPRRDTTRVLCPWHSEKKPSCDVTVLPGRIGARCRSCNAGGDHLHLYAAVQGLSLPADFRRAALGLAALLGVTAVETPSAQQPQRRPHDPVRELFRLLDRMPDYQAIADLSAALSKPPPTDPDERERLARRRQELERLESTLRRAHPETLREALRIYARAVRRHAETDAELDRLADLHEAAGSHHHLQPSRAA